MLFRGGCLAVAAALGGVPGPAGRVRLVCSGAGTPGIAESLAVVRAKVKAATSAAGREQEPRLVAVSKTKPVELLREAYTAGMRDFGENYVQELVEKARQMPDDVAWRFIGKLQSNKAKLLVQSVPSLAVVETVDSAKLADKLQIATASLRPPRDAPLGVCIQVNTSPWEGSKGGVLPDESVVALATHVHNACPDLRLVGLMTIGAPGDTKCFDMLASCREQVAAALGTPAEGLELSMGMSGDFEIAIAKGSSSVRVGSSIFGARAAMPQPTG